MRFRECMVCGGYAVAVQGPSIRTVCMDCIDREGHYYEDICSIVGCGNQPVILAMVEIERPAPVLVCEKHFKDIQGSIVSYIEIPTWLTNGNSLKAGDEGVVYQFDIGPDGDGAGSDVPVTHSRSSLRGPLTPHHSKSFR